MLFFDSTRSSARRTRSTWMGSFLMMMTLKSCASKVLFTGTIAQTATHRISSRSVKLLLFAQNILLLSLTHSLFPLDFISHSVSNMDLRFIFQECLGDKLKGKVFVDIGSRLGSTLYVVSEKKHLFDCPTTPLKCSLSF